MKFKWDLHSIGEKSIRKIILIKCFFHTKIMLLAASDEYKFTYVLLNQLLYDCFTVKSSSQQIAVVALFCFGSRLFFPYEFHVFMHVLGFDCVRIPQPLYNWMKSIIQSEAVIHFFLCQHAKHSNRELLFVLCTFVFCFSFARIHPTPSARENVCTQHEQHTINIVMDSVNVCTVSFCLTCYFKTGEFNIECMACVCVDGIDACEMTECVSVCAPNRMWNMMSKQKVARIQKRRRTFWIGVGRIHTKYALCYLAIYRYIYRTCSYSSWMLFCINNTMAVCFGANGDYGRERIQHVLCECVCYF